MQHVSGGPTAATFANLYQAGQNVQKHGIMHRLKDDTEGTLVLVGTWEVFIYLRIFWQRYVHSTILKQQLLDILIIYIFLYIIVHK